MAEPIAASTTGATTAAEAGTTTPALPRVAPRLAFVRGYGCIRLVPAIAAVALATLASCASSSAARSPRLEHLALSAPDMRTAAAALVRPGDLAGVPPGWQQVATVPDDAAPACPWQDYSRYTLTGRGQNGFQAAKLGGPGFIGSTVGIYSTVTDAAGKYETDTQNPGTARCESRRFLKALGAGLNIVSARELAAPRVGEHATAYQFVYARPTAPREIYINVLEFVRGRGVAVIDTTSFTTPGSAVTRLALARAIDRRLR